VPLTRLARFAWAVLISTIGVILWGASVRATGSGIGDILMGASLLAEPKRQAEPVLARPIHA
jgi:hypothetical protein